MKNKSLKLLFALCILFIQFSIFYAAEEFEKIRYKNRINAHGDEFMSLSLSSDEKRIAIGTEKGELIIWNVLEKKIEKRFSQDKPIHSVGFLKDNETVIIAGGRHTGIHNCLLRIWNIQTGKFTELEGGNESLLFLSSDNKNGQFAVSDAKEHISVWDANTKQKIASWKLTSPILGLGIANQSVFYTQISEALMKKIMQDEETEGLFSTLFTISVKTPQNKPRIFSPEKKGLLLGAVTVSPDGDFLAVAAVEDSNRLIEVINAKNGKFLQNTEATDSTWITNNKLLTTNQHVPGQILTILADGKTEMEKVDELKGFHSNGQPTKMSGVVSSKDSKRYWETFQQGGFFAEYDSNSKIFNIHIASNSLPFTMDVRERTDGNGFLATGGDDKFVRVWNLSDLALKREFQIPNGVPQGVALLSDEKNIIYSASGAKTPSDIFKSNIETGETKKLLTLEKSQVTVRTAINDFLYNLEKQIILASAEDGKTKSTFDFPEGIENIAVSANTKWLTVADAKGKLHLVDLTNKTEKALENKEIKDVTNVAVTNDGKYVYTTDFYAQLVQWETSTQKSKTIVDGFRGQASSLRLSVDENYAIIGGNHHDIAVYDIKTSERVFYNNDIDSSDFYVTNSWMKGNRLIFTSDGGVMYDGILEK